jgi:DNA mismatch repair ATPase MutS
MKETDIIALQKNSNGKNMYLVKVGMFYHAYDSAAFAIARLMHYKVKRKHRRNGDVLVAGFPIPQLENIIKNKVMNTRLLNIALCACALLLRIAHLFFPQDSGWQQQ